MAAAIDFLDLPQRTEFGVGAQIAALALGDGCLEFGCGQADQAPLEVEGHCGSILVGVAALALDPAGCV